MINRLFKLIKLPFYFIICLIYHILGILTIPISVILYLTKGNGELSVNMCGIGADIFETYLGKL